MAINATERRRRAAADVIGIADNLTANLYALANATALVQHIETNFIHDVFNAIRPR